MSDKKLKVWKVYARDHEAAGRIGRYDQTQPDIFHDLVMEPLIIGKVKENLPKAIEKNEEAKKTGKISLATQAADIAISTLKEIENYIEDRSR